MTQYEDIAWALEQAAVLAESGQRPDDGDPFNAGWNSCCKDIATCIRDMAREYDRPEPEPTPAQRAMQAVYHGDVDGDGSLA